MMIQRSRTPAIAALLFVLVAGLFFLGAMRHPASADESQLAQLQLAVAQPDAKPATWLLYADKLQQVGQYPRAVLAYRRILETDPYNRESRLACASCLANMKKPDDFFSFMKATIQVDPKLALNIFGRPEVAGYLSEARFQALRAEAVAQSMD
jgi:tetratricopeptide (TPR) repeat protein